MGLVIGEGTSGNIIIGNSVASKGNGNMLVESLIEFSGTDDLKGFAKTILFFIKEHEERLKIPNAFVEAFKEVDNGHASDSED